jgi:hypothetical protein
MDTTDKIIKTSINENRTLTIITPTDISALTHSVLWAHNPNTGLEHSTSQIHFTRSTLYISSAQFPLLSVVHSPRSAVRHTL